MLETEFVRQRAPLEPMALGISNLASAPPQTHGYECCGFVYVQVTRYALLTRVAGGTEYIVTKVGDVKSPESFGTFDR
jgi:hypothetical protein